MKHIIGIKRMTHQNSRHNSFLKVKHTVRALPIGACLLTSLLLVSSRPMTLGALANPVPSSLRGQIAANATLIYVNSQNGSDTPNAGNSPASSYRTITYALQQAQAGTVIQLAPGSYTAQTGEVFPLEVKQGVILRGDESTKGQTIGIIGGGTYLSPTLAGQNVTVVADNDSQIRGVGITNPTNRGTALWVESTNSTISNNTFSNSGREGVFITGTGNPKISDNVFTQNKGNGISVAKQSTGEIRNNVFDNTGIGIVVTETAAPLVAGNRITRNRDGVVASDSAAPVLRNNDVENNQEAGIVATTNANPNLGTQDSPGQNRIRNNGNYDVYNLTRNNTLVAVGNDIDKNHISGRVDFVAAVVAGKFQDIQGYWAQAYIEALAAKGFISGYPDSTFRPDAPVTRAEFAAIINKAFAPTPIQSNTNFVDLKSNFWAYQAIQTAYQGGFLSGYPGGQFRPDLHIPKVQVLVSLVSGLKLRSNDMSVLSVYNDANQIPDYARTAVAGATTKGLVVNYPTTSQLTPNRDATRAEVAAFVYQALVNAGRLQAIPSPYVVKLP